MGAFNIRRARSYRARWDWENMRGSKECLQLNLRDLGSLDETMRLTKKRSVAVQAGGNLGLFPKRLAEEFKAVYTFEPDRSLFACLEHNAPEENIVPINAALGCDRSPISVACGRRDGSGRPVHEGLTYINGEGDIPQILLDDLKLEACDLIYLDIEGYELNALRGAANTIARYMPVIAVEINGNGRHYGSSKDELRNWIADAGYVRVNRLHGDDIYVPGDKGAA
jgi:FkbM family methyltransferase